MKVKACAAGWMVYIDDCWVRDGVLLRVEGLECSSAVNRAVWGQPHKDCYSPGENFVSFNLQQ